MSRRIPWSGIVKEAIGKVLLVTKALCALHVTNAHICTFAFTIGPSMLPTFPVTGNLVLAEKISPKFGKVRVGDIVLVRSPVEPRMVVTKRVIGMEGDRVTYVVDPSNSDECNTIVVPKGRVWIEGDYMYNSRDSRMFGAIPYGLIKARVFWRVWPLKDFGPLGKNAHSSE